MATLSIRISDALLEELDAHAQALNVPRAEYVRRAIEFQNSEAAKEKKRLVMKAASAKVRAESLKVLHEFEALPDDLP
jgi:predicted transcriptional regulator